MRCHASEPRPISEAEIGWCAGFIDGEGCLSIHRQKNGRVSVQLRAVNTEREPIHRLRAILGGPVRLWSKRQAPRVPVWRWYCPQRELAGVLEALLPHLTVKRAQAEAVLGYLGTSWITDDKRAEIEAALSHGGKRGKGPRQRSAPRATVDSELHAEIEDSGAGEVWRSDR